MKISKLFHWLYALLMILPLLLLIFNALAMYKSGTSINYDTLLSYINFPNFTLLSSTIQSVFSYLVVDVFGLGFPLLINFLTYWVSVSIIYLVFDIVMYVPLLAHRWLDKGVLE